MGIDLYYSMGNSQSRIVLLVAKSIGIEFNLIPIDIFKQHETPELTKLNPQGNVPTINDNGFVLWESRAIIQYLQNQYGQDETLYPKEPKKRAVVDQRLFFDVDLYARFHDVYTAETFAGSPPNPEKLRLANESLEFLETFLEGSEFVAGDTLTLADLSIVIQISNLDVLKHDLSPYKNIIRWYNKVKAIAPGYKEANEDHFAVMKEIADKFAKSK